jgi:hypothetical protein
MSQITQTRKRYEERPVQRMKGYPNGYWWVQSDTHKQLWYRVVLTDDNEKVYCACPYFKRKREMCRHLIRVMNLEAMVL